MAIGSPFFEQAVEKAREREAELGEDLRDLTRRSRNAAPEQLADEREKQERLRFLESQFDEERDARKAFERIIAGNELQAANFLPRGALIARTILRVELRSDGGRLLGYGSGVLVGDGVLLTNHHVLNGPATARNAEAQAFYEVDVDGDEEEARRFVLDPDKLFFTSKELDFTLVAVAPRDKSGRERLAAIGWVPLIGAAGKAAEGEWLNIVQHPKGERKQLCLRENQLLKRAADVLWYSTDTQGGSSGSPVFNNNWLMVALHHSGVPETKNGKWQTLDGRDYDPNRDDESEIKWIANEGIRVSRMVQTLRDSSVADHPLVKPILSVDIGDIQARLPVLFSDKEDVARLLADSFVSRITPRRPVTAAPSGINPNQPSSEKKESDMTTRRVSVTLEIDEQGNVSVADSGSTEAALFEDALERTKKKKNTIHAPVIPKVDWIGGYDPDFLQKPGPRDPALTVHLPVVKRKALIAPLVDAYGQTFTAPQKAAGVLKYKGYSVVMNKDRRFAFFSAANVDGGMRPSISGRDDNWLLDERISPNHQLDNSFYAGNRFDRGHLTRRDDMEWGSDVLDAVNRANGTCTWPNCAAQHDVFNQGKDKSVLLWQNLERYILEETAAFNQFRAQVITGPIFGGNDPKFREITYPLEYWKVVVAVTASGKLFATGYVLSQKATIDKFGLEEADLEVPFGAFGTYQRPIRLIENATGLEFTFGANKDSLSEVDPLETSIAPRRRRRGSGAEELFGGGSDDALESLDDIILY